MIDIWYVDKNSGATVRAELFGITVARIFYDAMVAAGYEMLNKRP